MASSAVLKVMMGTTRAEDLHVDGHVSRLRHVHDNRRLDEGAVAAAAENDLAALLHGELDLLLHGLGGLLGDEAADLGVLLQRHALLQGVDLLHDLLRELLGHVLVPEEALGGAAHLAGVVQTLRQQAGALFTALQAGEMHLLAARSSPAESSA